MSRTSLDFFEGRRLGDLISRLTGDVAAIENMILSGVTSVLGYLLRIAFFAGLLFYLRWDLAVSRSRSRRSSWSQDAALHGGGVRRPARFAVGAER